MLTPTFAERHAIAYQYNGLCRYTTYPEDIYRCFAFDDDLNLRDSNCQRTKRQVNALSTICIPTLIRFCIWHASASAKSEDDAKVNIFFENKPPFPVFFLFFVLYGVIADIVTL